MNIRNNPDNDVVEIQVDEDEWRPLEEVAVEAQDKSLRTYLQERYGKVIDMPMD